MEKLKKYEEPHLYDVTDNYTFGANCDSGAGATCSSTGSNPGFNCEGGNVVSAGDCVGPGGAAF